MEIIALVGFKGSGKDTAANTLVQNHGFQRMAFADALKDAVAAIFCWPRSMIEGDTPESRIWRETVDQWWAERLVIPHFTPRWALQNFGTNVMRKHFNPDIWILNIERKFLNLNPGDKVVITDGRFPNELALARKFGGAVVRVKRGPEPEWFETAFRANNREGEWETARNQMTEEYKVHESEWSWIGQDLDAVLENDSTPDALREKMSEFYVNGYPRWFAPAGFSRGALRSR